MTSTSLLDRKWLERLNQLLLANSADANYNNAAVAAALGISDSTLHRKLVRITDKTPLTYIRQFRLQQAKDLIESGQYATVKEVAFAVGFLNPNYFSQRYAALFGKRPSAVLNDL